MSLTLEDRILTKLDKLESDVANVNTQLAALSVHMSTQHARILTLEQSTRKTVWYVFGVAGTVIASITAAAVLAAVGVV